VRIALPVFLFQCSKTVKRTAIFLHETRHLNKSAATLNFFEALFSTSCVFPSIAQHNWGTKHSAQPNISSPQLVPLVSYRPLAPRINKRYHFEGYSYHCNTENSKRLAAEILWLRILAIRESFIRSITEYANRMKPNSYFRWNWKQLGIKVKQGKVTLVIFKDTPINSYIKEKGSSRALGWYAYWKGPKITKSRSSTIFAV